MTDLIEWAKLTWEQARDVLSTPRVAVLPIGAIEQHGPHMTLEVDTLAAEALARRVCRATGAVLLPAVPFGQVWSLSRFPGSLSLRVETLEALLGDLADEVRRQGFGALVVLSGHLGNVSAMKAVARAQLDAAQFPVLHLFYPGLGEAARGVVERPQSHPGIVHADELETSLILALAPDAVDMKRAVAEYPDFPEDFDVRARYWDELCETGVFGDATAASAEKGRRILAGVEERIVGLIATLQAEITL